MNWRDPCVYVVFLDFQILGLKRFACLSRFKVLFLRVREPGNARPEGAG